MPGVQHMANVRFCWFFPFLKTGFSCMCYSSCGGGGSVCVGAVVAGFTNAIPRALGSNSVGCEARLHPL